MDYTPEKHGKELQAFLNSIKEKVADHTFEVKEFPLTHNSEDILLNALKELSKELLPSTNEDIFNCVLDMYSQAFKNGPVSLQANKEKVIKSSLHSFQQKVRKSFISNQGSISYIIGISSISNDFLVIVENDLTDIHYLHTYDEHKEKWSHQGFNLKTNKYFTPQINKSEIEKLVFNLKDLDFKEFNE